MAVASKINTITFLNKIAISYKLILLLITVSLPNTEAINAQQVKFNNPVLIGGSDFLKVFQEFYKLSNFNTMLKFTASESIAHFGADKILEKYKSVDFGYTTKLKSVKKDSSTYILNYEAKIQATKVMIRMKVVIENDSTKIKLPDNFLQQQIFLYQ